MTQSLIDLLLNYTRIFDFNERVTIEVFEGLKNGGISNGKQFWGSKKVKIQKENLQTALNEFYHYSEVH